MSEYDETMHGVVREKIDRIKSDWIAGKLNAESMESLLLYARAGVDIALAAKKISETSKALVEEAEIKIFRSEMETALAPEKALPVLTKAEEMNALRLNAVVLIKGQPRIKRHDGQWLGVGKDSGSTAITTDYILYWYGRVEVLYAPDGPVNV